MVQRARRKAIKTSRYHYLGLQSFQEGSIKLRLYRVSAKLHKGKVLDFYVVFFLKKALKSQNFLSFVGNRDISESSNNLSSFSFKDLLR
jgi:hypothetical protein